MDVTIDGGIMKNCLVASVLFGIFSGSLTAFGSQITITLSNYDEAGHIAASDVRDEIKTYVLDGKVTAVLSCKEMMMTFNKTFTDEIDQQKFYVIAGFDCESESESGPTEMVYLLHLEPRDATGLAALGDYLRRKQDTVLWGSKFHFWKSYGVFMQMSLTAGNVEDDPEIPNLIHVVNPISIERFEKFVPNLGDFYAYLNSLSARFESESLEPLMQYITTLLGAERSAEYEDQVLKRAQGIHWDPRPRMILENTWLNTPAHWVMTFDCRRFQSGRCR